MINQLVSHTIDITKYMVINTSTDLMGHFVKTEIKTKGPLTLKEQVPLTKFQLLTLSIPIGKTTKEKKLKEISTATESYLHKKTQELINEIAEICEDNIEKMWINLECAGKNFDSLLKGYAGETSSSNTKLGSLYDIIKAKETMIPDMVIYDCIFETHSFEMWYLTKEIPSQGYWIYVPPNPIDQMRNNMAHLYENLFGPIAEYLESQTSKLRKRIGEPFERLKTDLNEYGKQIIDNIKKADGIS